VVLSTKAPLPGCCASGSADTTGGTPLGVKFDAMPAPSPSAIGTPAGVSMPALGSCSTKTSLASPQDLPTNDSRLDRPTVHAGYWPIIADVSENTSNATNSHVAIAKGDSIIRRHRPSGSPLGRG